MALDPDENPTEAVLKFESMLRTDDVYFFDSEDFEDIVHHYLNLGKVTLGKKALQIGLQQHPHSGELKLLNVEVMVFEDRFVEAEVLLDELQQVDATNEEIFIQRANILSKKDDHQGAITMLLKALRITEDSFDVYSILGMEYLFLDDFERAKKCFIKCVEHDENDYSALYNVVYCFEFLEDFDGAIHYLNRYVDKHPYCEVAWHQLGKMFYAKSMFKEALAAFDFAIISDDSFLGAYFEKGKVLENLGKYEEAIECYKTTLDMDDPTSHAYLRIGKCYGKLGKDDTAKYYYYKTVHEDPLLDKGWVAITKHYLKAGDYDKALRYITKAINIDSQNPAYWKISGDIFHALKNYDEADFSYKNAVDLGNYELDTWSNWSLSLMQLKDYESAMQVLYQGVEFFPENPDLHYLFAGVGIKTLNFDVAKEKLVQALDLDADKAHLFLLTFPEYEDIPWVSAIISAYKGAST